MNVVKRIESEEKTEAVRDDGLKMIIKEFYYIYRRLQKRYKLRMHSRFSILADGIIEIWQYKGNKRIRTICRVKEEDVVECFKKAIEELKYFEGQE